MRCNMSLKVHFLDSHLDFNPENLSGQWAAIMECDFTRVFPPRYQGKWSPSMVWMITAGHLDGKFQRQSVAESDPLLLIR
jgi:hypothetical protein